MSNNMPPMPVEGFTADTVSQSPTPKGGGMRAPTIAAAQHAIVNIRTLLHPRKQTGYGHGKNSLRPFVTQRLQEMLTFLRMYIYSARGWMGSSLVAANFLGQGRYFSRQLRCWSLAFILDRSKLPDKRSLMGRISRLQDEDVKSDINMHLQSLGKYVSAMDLV